MRQSAGITFAIATILLLVVEIVPLPGTENWRLEFHWSAPATPPAAGTWAGQANHFGFRFNRYSDGSGYTWIPIWLFALAPVAVAVGLLGRGRRGVFVLGLMPLILALLFVRSLKQEDFVIGLNHSNGLRVISVGYGQIRLWNVRWPAGTLQDWISSYGTAVDSLDVEMKPRLTNLFGFAVASSASGQLTVAALAIPYWPLIVVTAVPPLLLWRRKVRMRRRSRLNQCLTCGYDLRETPERCPECGATGAGLRPHVPASSAA